jgi:DnaJ family protein C protein 2
VILDAYNTLLDSRKRQIYDATLEFNDHIPERFEGTEEEFVETFDRLFLINSYWSEIKPVP